MSTLAPRWSSATFLLYAGGAVALVALGAFLAAAAPDRGWALLGYAALAFVASLGIAEWLRRDGRAIAAGVVAAVAVAMFGATVAAFADLIGLDVSGGGFEAGTHLTEVAVSAGALAALRVFRSPILVLPAAGAALALALDVVEIAGSDTLVSLAALLAGGGLAALATTLDATAARPYGFWLHVLAALATAFAFVDLLEGSWWGWTLIALLSLGYVFLARLLTRSVWAVVGTLGLFAATTYFVDAQTSIASFVPLPLEDDNSLADWQIALVYVLLGLVYLGLGLVLSRRDDSQPPAA